MPYLGKSPSQGVRSRYQFTPNAGTTSLSGADANGDTLTFTDGNYVDVYLNGVMLKAGVDYVTTTANTIGSLAATVASDVVDIIVYDTFSVFGGTLEGNVKVNNGTLNVTGAVDFDSTLNVDGSLTGTTARFSGNTTIGGSTVTDSNMLNIQGNGSSVNVGAVFNKTNSTAQIWSTQVRNSDNAFLIHNYTASSTPLVISTAGAVTFGGTINTTGTSKIQFGDSGTYIHQSADGVLDLVSDTEIEINATTIDMNGAVDISGNATIGGSIAATTGAFTDTVTVLIPDGGADNAYAMQIKNEEATDDRSYGLLIHAGSTDTDRALVINDHDGSNPLFYVHGNGRVGIGTTSANNTLDVNGGIVCSPNTDGKDTFELSTNDLNEGRLRIKNVDTTTVQIRAGGDSYFNGGNVLIGTTVAGRAAEGADRLTIADASHSGLTIRSGTGGNSNLYGSINFSDQEGGTGEYAGQIWYGHGTLGEKLVLATQGSNRLVVTEHVEVVDGDLVIGTSGHGISFAATSDASGMTSELLDDYEEGTFTMGFSGATFSNLGTNNAIYVKIGRMVHISYYSGAQDITSASGIADFTGLPFTVKNTGAAYSSVDLSHNTFFGGSATVGQQAYFQTNTTTGRFNSIGGFSTNTFVNGTSRYIMISGTYQTD